MPSADRKVLHDALAAIDGVASRSEGEDPNRRVDRRARLTDAAARRTGRWSRRSPRRSASGCSASARSTRSSTTPGPSSTALAGVTGTVVDLGSGGGVPGLVIADARPDLRLVLVDRRATRTDHLRRLVGRLGLADRVEVVERPTSRRRRCRASSPWPVGPPLRRRPGAFGPPADARGQRPPTVAALAARVGGRRAAAPGHRSRRRSPGFDRRAGGLCRARR